VIRAVTVLAGFDIPTGALASQGSSLRLAVRLVIHVTDMHRHSRQVYQVQQESWGVDAAFPPRSIVQVEAHNQDDTSSKSRAYF
jgi:hypothetical protein